MRSFILAVLALVPLSSSQAHFHMLLVDHPSVKTGDKLTTTYKFGHPFEAELFDAEKPAQAQAFGPDRTTTVLLPSLTKTTVGENEKKKITGYTCTFEPKARGDYTVIFVSTAIWIKEEQYFVQDTVRVNIHDQAEKGWRFRHPDLAPYVFVPLTRPYGLRPGTVFQSRLNFSGQFVELEKYNAEPQKELPTREFRNLNFTTVTEAWPPALPEKGRWVLSSRQTPRAMTLPETKERESKKYLLLRRATLCVYVDGEPANKPEK